MQAERILKESGISIEKRARAVDRLSAQILLESYLGRRRALTRVNRAEDHRNSVCAGAAGRAALYADAYTSYKGFENEVFIEFPRGLQRAQMADRLASEGVIR
jgi:hypothetical protein